jgi:hypothetical protein
MVSWMLAKAKTREREPWHVRLRLTPLTGWITLGEAAEDLGISRQAVHRLVERGALRKKDLRTVGRRPVIIVREKAIRDLPMTPQRRRELDLRAADAAGPDGADLDDELPAE